MVLVYVWRRSHFCLGYSNWLLGPTGITLGRLQTIFFRLILRSKYITNPDTGKVLTLTSCALYATIVRKTKDPNDELQKWIRQATEDTSKNEYYILPVGCPGEALMFRQNHYPCHQTNGRNLQVYGKANDKFRWWKINDDDQTIEAVVCPGRVVDTVSVAEWSIARVLDKNQGRSKYQK